MVSRVTLAVEGLMPERFLNKAVEEGARIASAHRKDGRLLVLTLDPRSAGIVRALAERYSMACKTLSVTGIRAVFEFLRRRPTIIAAYAAMLVCLALFLSRIWIIEVRDLGGGVSAQVYETLHRAKVSPGIAASGVDTRLLSLELAALDGVSYASVARKGVTLTVEIAGEKAVPDVYDYARVRDLVAACDGIVSSVNVKSGTAMVKTGDLVRRGQVLISGEERVSKDETRAVGALGSVTARIWCEGNAEGRLTYAAKEYTGRKSVSKRICLLGLTLNIARAEEYQAFDHATERVYVGGLFLPLTVERVVYTEYIPRTVKADRAALEGELADGAITAAEDKIAKLAPENAEIIDKWIDFSMIDTDTLSARAVIEYTADIAVTRQYLEEN